MTPPTSRPVRSLHLTAKLKDSDNASTPELSFQRRAVQDFRARQGQGSAASETGHRPALAVRTSLSRSHTSLSTASSGTSQKKRAHHSVSDNSGSEDDEPGLKPGQGMFKVS